jgi:hypothetical protein
MEQETRPDNLSVSVRRAPICSACGSPMTYEGPQDIDPEHADQSGAFFICPHGHIEAIDPND